MAAEGCLQLVAAHRAARSFLQAGAADAALQVSLLHWELWALRVFCYP